MSIFSFIGSLFAPVTKLIDEVSTTDEEKMTLRNELARIQSEANSKLIELEETKINALSKVQEAEANSTHFITATWRPMTCLALVSLIIAESFGLATLSKEIYSLTEIMLGGYAIGRSGEKIVKVAKLGK